MKQYKNQRLNFAGCAVPATWRTQATLEAIIGTCYNDLERNSRRRKSKSAIAWWRSQVSTEGMPWLYHCGGVA